ncbi:MAG: AraC family transcriptional regulator [Planctomycetes bacterium]|nr:AraC family transcriptional regulator [Planctomycetota bacterium]
MLQEDSGPTWRQIYLLPNAGDDLDRCEVAVAVLGRFRSTGLFDYRQMPTRVSLHLVHAGEGEVAMGGRQWRAGPGSVFCFMPGREVRYRVVGGHSWRYTWINLVGTRAVAFASRLGGVSGQEGVPWSRDDLPISQVAALLDEIEAVFRSDEHSPFYAQAAAWRLLDGLTPRTAATDRSAHLATAVRRILDEQFVRPLKLGSLARQLGFDRSTVFRRFQALYGCPPKEYLDRLRLDHAVALLRDGGISVAAVSDRCGFASAHRFAKAFRAHYGVSPSRYRGGSPLDPAVGAGPGGRRRRRRSIP